ncbi:NUDIX hydrolase [Caldicellulosiruptoraceae bacterium PP1]
MLIRNCAGGVIFYQGKIFIMKNEKNEWVFPKGVIKNGDIAPEVATKRVKEEVGIDAKILSSAGQTSYEFFSVTRQRPVCNKITWYIMEATSEDFLKENHEENVFDAGYFTLEDALSKITYSQDRALASLAFEQYKQLVNI